MAEDHGPEPEDAVLFIAFGLFLGAITRQLAKNLDNYVKIPYTAVYVPHPHVQP